MQIKHFLRKPKNETLTLILDNRAHYSWTDELPIPYTALFI